MSNPYDHVGTPWPGRRPPTRLLDSGTIRSYVRFAALGDSATYDPGEPARAGLRGWVRILALAVSRQHDVSFCDLTVPGSTSGEVRHRQVREAVAHRPHLASFVVGLNDAMQADWDVGEVRENLLQAADQLAWCGAVLLTVTFHDHSRVCRLPRHTGTPLSRRIDDLNEIYDEMKRDYETVHVNLTERKEVYQPQFWSLDRLQPSESGHRFLACVFAEALNASGLTFPPPVSESNAAPFRR